MLRLGGTVAEHELGGAVPNGALDLGADLSLHQQTPVSAQFHAANHVPSARASPCLHRP